MKTAFVIAVVAVVGSSMLGLTLGWVYRNGIKAGMARMKQEIAENRHLDLDQRQLAWGEGRDAAMLVSVQTGDYPHEPGREWTNDFAAGRESGIRGKERAIRRLVYREPQ